VRLRLKSKRRDIIDVAKRLQKTIERLEGPLMRRKTPTNDEQVSLTAGEIRYLYLLNEIIVVQQRETVAYDGLRMQCNYVCNA
jgi:hypothetical protein